ncbi:unnamed protein product [Dracunculus medinensis]|uniref:G_PROTEIN_RECEP_F1_2 domain-containing protein n=1 Tax=Dracunculus medinensis TaxID=318479 RepID=A0A158Q4M1_DRAME|nr:unnamed protein product [Dracunculus medinensis]
MEKFASDCLAAQTLANSVYFILLITVVAIISMIGIIVQIIIMKKYVICMAIHENTRILLVAHQIYLILHCVARIVAHTADLIVFHWNYHDPCMYLSTPLRCFIIRTPITFTFYSIPCSILVLTAERAIGTYQSAKYERMGRSLAYILIFIDIFLPAALVVFTLYGLDTFGTTKSRIYCSSVEKNNLKRGNFAAVILFLIEIGSVFLLRLLLHINMRIRQNRIEIDLSQRYQLKENITSITTIAPLILCHSIFYSIFLLAFIIYFVIKPAFSQDGFAIFLESGCSINASLFIIICVCAGLYGTTLPIADMCLKDFLRTCAISGTDLEGHRGIHWHAVSNKDKPSDWKYFSEI